MKASFYNLYFPLNDKNSHIIYNTLSGSTFVVDNEALNAIKNFKDGLINKKLLSILKEENILIDDNTNERLIYKCLSNKKKFYGFKSFFTILSSYACNMSCTYCYEKYFFEKNGEIKRKTMNNKNSNLVIKFIKNIIIERNYKNITIVFFGGEPLLNIKQVYKILESLDPWIKNLGLILKVHFVSNGTLITIENIKRLKKYNPTFQITLAGSKEIHDKMRKYKNGKGTYEDIMYAIDLLKRFQIRFFIRVDVGKETYAHIEELLTDLKKRFGNGLSIGFASIIPGAGPNCSFRSSCLTDDELAKFPTLWELAEKRGFSLVMTPIIKYVYCTYYTDHAYIIDPSRDLYKCEGIVGLKDHRIGKIDRNGKIKINYQYYNWLSIDPLTSKECRNCSLLPACGGGCAGIAYDKHGTYHKTVCHMSKHLITHRIKYHLKKLNFNL